MTQGELQFESPWRHTKHGSEAWDYFHTPEGGQVANEFIRLALHCKNHLHKHVGQRAILEKIRWDYEIARTDDAEYKINNNILAFLVRFTEERVPELRGYFKKREIGRCRKMVQEITVRKYA